MGATAVFLNNFMYKEKDPRTAYASGFSGLFSNGDEGDRTPYLLNAIQALSQVSYAPKHCKNYYT